MVSGINGPQQGTPAQGSIQAEGIPDNTLQESLVTQESRLKSYRNFARPRLPQQQAATQQQPASNPQQPTVIVVQVPGQSPQTQQQSGGFQPIYYPVYMPGQQGFGQNGFNGFGQNGFQNGFGQNGFRPQQGMQGQAGQNGQNGLNGRNGQNGQNGAQGPQGPAGPVIDGAAIGLAGQAMGQGLGAIGDALNRWLNPEQPQLLELPPADNVI